MKAIIIDWCNFCEGKIAFDKSHFYTLFWENNEQDKITRSDLVEIFKYFPKSKELFNLMESYLFDKSEKRNTTNDYLIELAKKDIYQKISLSKKLDHFKSYPIHFINDFKVVEELKNHEDYFSFYDEVSDMISDKWLLEDKKTFALQEAFYGLAKNYEIVWYLFSPLINVRINFEYFFEFTCLGGVYSIHDNKIIISRRF
jgi:hypothetical protein